MSNLSLLPSIPLGLYRHYKEREYEVLGLACHSETLEPLVIYRPLQPIRHLGTPVYDVP
jgi:hypothetical protein